MPDGAGGKPFVRPRPLADPLAIVTIVCALWDLLALGFLQLPCRLYPHARLSSSMDPCYDIAVSAWVGLTMGIALTLLLSPTRPPNAIYLRAFKTDRSTAKLRRRLIAMLGPGFRLAGIRPPRERGSSFTRLFLPTLMALRYSGSHYMELEAGDDWLQRLWSTYHSTRIAFIDVRETTPNVHREIAMTLFTLGPSRCVFLINRRKTVEGWLIALSKVLGPEYHPDANLHTLQLLDVSEEAVSSGGTAKELAAIVARLPGLLPADSMDGWDFLVERSEPKLLKSSLRKRHSTFAAVVATAAGFAAFCIGCTFLVERFPLAGLLIWLVAAPGVALYISAIYRSAVAAWQLGWAGHWLAAVRAWLVLALVLINIGYFGMGDMIRHLMEQRRTVERAVQARTEDAREEDVKAHRYEKGGVFHSDVFGFDYTFPAGYETYVDDLNAKLKRRAGQANDDEKKILACMSYPLELQSAGAEDEFREVTIEGFDGRCMDLDTTPDTLYKVAVDILSEDNLTVPIGKPVHYKLQGQDASLVYGTLADTGIEDAAVACAVVGRSVVCWKYDAHSCDLLAGIESLPVSTPGHAPAAVVPRRLEPRCKTQAESTPSKSEP